MLDFTSALYLGLAHPSVALAPWRALTQGRPAALAEAPGAGLVAANLARLTGLEAGLLYPSTLHLFHDLFGVAATGDTTLLMDANAYAIARWGAAPVRLDGTPCEIYAHHDSHALAKKARRAFRAGRRPVIVTDGLCPSCGQLAPLPALATVASETGGTLIIDDTQALGIMGRRAGNAAPLGLGGGGTLAWFGLHGHHIVTGSSLAKGFGAPLAALLGHTGLITRVAREGPARVHASPPSAASIAAAAAALAASDMEGDLSRARLLRRVEHLRRGLARLGAHMLSALPLPVQTIAMPSVDAARRVVAALETGGIRTLITRACAGGVALSILLTARHAARDVERLISALARALPTATHAQVRIAVS